MGDLRPGQGRNFAIYGRLPVRKRSYMIIYDRRNREPGLFMLQFGFSESENLKKNRRKIN